MNIQQQPVTSNVPLSANKTSINQPVIEENVGFGTQKI